MNKKIVFFGAEEGGDGLFEEFCCWFVVATTYFLFCFCLFFVCLFVLFCFVLFLFLFFCFVLFCLDFFGLVWF